MRVHAHLDPVVLEHELLSRVDRTHRSADPLRTLIVVPTARLAGHVERRLARRRACWLGLDVVDLHSLPERIRDTFCGSGGSRCPPRLLEALLQRQLFLSPDNPWSRFVRRRPGALQGVMGAITDLREADVSPDQLETCRLDKEGRGLAEVYRHYVQALEEIGTKGWTDDAGLAKAALPHAARFAGRYRSILVHGTYELIGAQLELIRAMDGIVEIDFLLPASGSSSDRGYAAEFARTFLLDSAGSIEPLEVPSELGDRPPLDALYDEERRTSPSAEMRYEFRHCQGAASEVLIAVRQALRAIRAGCPPCEIAIVAGALAPYAAALEEALDDAGLSWTSALRSPLCRQPAARDFLLMLEVLADDFPRRPTVELLASPRVRWRSFTGRPGPRGADRADVWSRKARLIGGLDQWTEALPRWAERSTKRHSEHDTINDEQERIAAELREDVDCVVASLSALEAAVDPSRPRSWAAQARALEPLLDALDTDPAESSAGQVIESLAGLLKEMAQLETIVGDDRRVPFQEVRSWLVDTARAGELSLRRSDNGGIRVLDAMQARGSTFREVHLLGLNSGLFPRTSREDPVLPDSLRRQLRERHDRPLPLASQGNLEQRLLLTMTLGSSFQRMAVSWQRADEAGRASSPSLALREVARVAYGAPDLDALLTRAKHVPSHPIQSLQDLLEDPGLISSDEARLLAALVGPGPELTVPLAECYPELTAGLRMIRATESFSRVDAAYDARVGACGSEDGLSVSSLETLGRCPLQHFFRHILHVKEMELEIDPLEIAANEWGLVVHDLLERVYRELAESGLFDGNLRDLEQRAIELLGRKLPRAVLAVGSELSRRLPVLWGGIAESWDAALVSFVRLDLRRIMNDSWKPTEFEEVRTETVDLGEGVQITLRGRFDRRLVGEDGVLIGDYKTGKIGKKCNASSMLKGQTLQVPLYRLMTGGEAAVELLGVGPAHTDDEEAVSSRFTGFEKPEVELGFRETVRVLVELRNGGTFPFNKGHHCNLCAYAKACRRNHPPSAERELAAADSASYRLLRKKNRSKPTLARAREAPR